MRTPSTPRRVEQVPHQTPLLVAQIGRIRHTSTIGSASQNLEKFIHSALLPGAASNARRLNPRADLAQPTSPRWPRRAPPAIGRLDRPGQTGRVLAYFLTSEEGADPTMIEVLGTKRMQADPFVDPDAAALVPVDTTDRVR